MNKNPSGPNQPLNQHPLPNIARYSLAKDVQVNLDIDKTAGAETLVIPPPPKGAIREVPAKDLACMFGILQDAGADPATVVFVYRDGNGNAVDFGVSEVLAAPFGFDTLGLATGFVLTPEDEGIFIKIVETSVDPAKIGFIASYDDVRNVERADTILTESFQDVIPKVEDGNAMFITQALPILAPIAYILNYDSAGNAVSARVTINGESVTIPGIGFGTGITIWPLPCNVFSPGSKGELKLDAALTDPSKSIVAAIATSLTNQGPARQDQGGAY